MEIPFLKGLILDRLSFIDTISKHYYKFFQGIGFIGLGSPGNVMAKNFIEK